MSSTKAKKYLFWLFFLFFGALFAVALLVIIIDPFFQYHKPLANVNYRIDNQVNQNPGIAKNFTYDSVILGSSMTDNFDTSLFNEYLGLNTVKLSFNGAFPRDIDTLLALAVKSPNDLKEVFLGIDTFTYKAQPGATAYEVPAYLYDDNLLNDVFYLLNKEVLLDYILRPHANTPFHEIYWFWQDVTYGADAVLASYSVPTEFQDSLPADYYESNIRANLEQYILPYITSMPDTQFTVFFPPYSVLYWYSRFADGSLEAEIQGQKQIMETLLSYPNVRIFYFQDDYDFICNLDNYSDYTHFTHTENDYMTKCFADGIHELTLSDYESVLNSMQEWLLGQDLSKYVISY